jgi:hypothetical protein
MPTCERRPREHYSDPKPTHAAPLGVATRSEKRSDAPRHTTAATLGVATRPEKGSDTQRDSRSAPRRGLLSLSLLCLADDLPNLGRLPPGRHRGLEYIVYIGNASDRPTAGCKKRRAQQSVCERRSAPKSQNFSSGCEFLRPARRSSTVAACSGRPLKSFPRRRPNTIRGAP